MEYQEYIEGKRWRTGFDGLEPPDALHDSLFDFQLAVCRWAIAKGRAAVFLDCGLGKCRISLEWARAVVEQTGGSVLVLAPLAVGHQFKMEAAAIGISDMVHLCRQAEDVRPGINVTNYERVERFNAASFAGVILDESSILKNHTGYTRNTLISLFAKTPYRLCCTATPSPNDHIELGNHAEFLGVMKHSEMLSTYFINDAGTSQGWRIKKHATQEFWRWVASWAIAMRKPSDLGFDDKGFILPELRIVEHRTDNSPGLLRRRGLLFDTGDRTINAQREARRDSLGTRVDIAAKLAQSKSNGNSEPWLVWCGLNAESDALTAAIPDAVEIRGSDNPDDKEDRLVSFTKGETRVLVTKPSIAGFGMNWQHCSKAVFCGVSHSWEQWYQAVRRIYRFGQKNPVECHVIYSEGEGAVMDNLKRKQQQYVEMSKGMVDAMKEGTLEELGLSQKAADTSYSGIPTIPRWLQGATTPEPRTCARTEVVKDDYAVYNADCVDLVSSLPADSIHFSVFSPPFAQLYTYSDSLSDMGNCRNHGEFFGHFAYLIPELYRVTKPGRLVSFHCMNLPTQKYKDGVIGLVDFRGKLIAAFAEAGWIFHSEVCIWKNPVTAMQRTKALGLLYKQLCKDSTMSRQGIADYMVTMRKPGENPEPVSHEWNVESDVSLPTWQKWASPIWTDINQSDTLQYRSAREQEDEKHICPLQLEVIRRALKLWSNPRDIVLSPFAGIGSEGYVALQQDRRFIGVELKGSYYEQAVANLANARRQTEMF